MHNYFHLSLLQKNILFKIRKDFYILGWGLLQFRSESHHDAYNFRACGGLTLNGRLTKKYIIYFCVIPGVKIFSLIKNEMQAHNIPWDNCLALGCDNANVMVGKDTGLYGCMLKEHPKLYLSGCVCHLIHIAAEKGK